MFIKKSQSAIEFLVLIGGVFLFIMVFLLLFQKSILEKYDEQTNILINDLGDKIYDEINLALNAREGYYREFELPKKIGNKDYNATLQENNIYLITLDKKHAVSIPIKEINGDLNLGVNIIQKKNKEVYLNDL